MVAPVAEFSVRVTDKLGEASQTTLTMMKIVTKPLLSATNILTTVLMTVDYINDRDHSAIVADKLSPTPSSNPEVSAGVIFREMVRL